MGAPHFSFDVALAVGLLLAVLAGLSGLVVLAPGLLTVARRRVWILWLELRRARRRAVCVAKGHDADVVTWHSVDGHALVPVRQRCLECLAESAGWTARSGSPRPLWRVR